MKKNQGQRTGMSGLFILFLIFLVLKLTNVIDWSWWWVTAPMWGPSALLLVGFILYFLITGTHHYLRAKRYKNRA